MSPAYVRPHMPGHNTWSNPIPGTRPKLRADGLTFAERARLRMEKS